MLDRFAIRLIQPLVACLGQGLARRGVSANQLSFLGFGLGLLAAALITQQAYLWGLTVILASRLCDGLDGAVARSTQPTDRGGFLDITLDFIFYAAIPLAFALADPAANALAAAVLLAAFMGTGSSFLAFAVIASKRGMTSTAYPDKSFYFLGGLTEATETLAFFAAICLWPQHFPALALVFAALCAVTTSTRLWWGWRAFD